MNPLDDYTLALLGCGRMGSALLLGGLNRGVVTSDRACVYDVDADVMAALAQSTGAKPCMPTSGPVVWIVAVKPQYVAAALDAAPIKADDVVISVAAGVRLAALRASAPDAILVRTMPNTPALVGEGITGVLADPRGLAVADALFGAVGDVVHLTDEKQFDAVTAVSGSGPAYVFVAIEALADGGVAMGLPRAMALKLAIKTVLGSAALAASEGVHPAELKDRVASPGGTTIAGLAQLERGGFRAALIDAVRAATERSRQLGE